MRIARTFPRSSVTWWLSSGLGQASGTVDEGTLGRRDVDAEAAERGGGRARTGGGCGARPATDPGERRAQLRDEARRQLGERVADHPRPRAVVGGSRGSRLSPQEG